MTHKTKLEFKVGEDPRGFIIDALPSQLNPFFEQWTSLADALERSMGLGEKELVWKLIFYREAGGEFNFCEAKCKLQDKKGRVISSFDRIRIYEYFITDHIKKIEPHLFAPRIAQELGIADELKVGCA